MTIRCFLGLSQYDAYLMIYRKLYYKWHINECRQIIEDNDKFYDECNEECKAYAEDIYWIMKYGYSLKPTFYSHDIFRYIKNKFTMINLF